jgi:hypothetical protein
MKFPVFPAGVETIPTGGLQELGPLGGADDSTQPSRRDPLGIQAHDDEGNPVSPPLPGPYRRRPAPEGSSGEQSYPGKHRLINHWVKGSEDEPIVLRVGSDQKVCQHPTR